MPETDFITDAPIDLPITGMDCANCALTLERSVGQVAGVEQVDVNFTTGRLRAEGSADVEAIVKRVQAMGYDVGEPETDSSHAPVSENRPGGVIGFGAYLLASRQSTLIFAAAGMLIVAQIIASFASGSTVALLALLLRLTAIGLVGYPIFVQGIRSLVVGKQVTIDLLMTIAVAGALAIGEVGEAATVILLFAVGEALEGYSADRARDSLRSLLSLKPEQATVLRPCMDCAEHIGQDGYTGGPCPFCGTHEVTVPAAEVAIGDRILVRPGERIAVDGRVVDGVSDVDQAPITGESVPVSKVVGDKVFAGTVNGAGALEIEATQRAADSTLSQIVRLVEEAQSRRSPAERYIDRFARWYTPAVVAVAILTASVPPLLFGQPFVSSVRPTDGWLYRALSLLIVACPCALVISTPVTVVSSLTSLARRGVLVKGGVFLEALSRVKTFAFDKTGTLTAGTPVVVRTQTVVCEPGQVVCEPCNDLLAVAAAVERRSEHPLAQAIVAEASARGIAHRYPPASQVTALAGKGIVGQMGGEDVLVGSHGLIHHDAPDCARLHDAIKQAEAAGETVMLVSRTGQVMGFVSVADAVRPEAGETLTRLKGAQPGLQVAMLTGDNPVVAASVAAELGNVDDVRAGLLPADKVTAVEALTERYGPVAMVGDGVNDAPALAAAEVGIAMGGAGTAQAIETADVVLMNDDLDRLVDLLMMSRRNQRVIRQNVGFSIAIKLVFLALTLPGLATLWMAVFADMGASLLVTLNGMRMLRQPRGVSGS